jgi:signal peptidase II
MNNWQPEENNPPPDTPRPASRSQQVILFLVAGTVILLDQFSKQLVEQSLALYEVWAPIPAIEPFFRIMHATNTGAAFGLFQGGSLLFAILALVVSGGILYYNHTLPAGHNGLRVALGLTLGGALGNLIDRFRLGHVTDFLDFGPWPIFNVADMAVVGGALLLGWLTWRESRQMKQAELDEVF